MMSLILQRSAQRLNLAHNLLIDLSSLMNFYYTIQSFFSLLIGRNQWTVDWTVSRQLLKYHLHIESCGTPLFIMTVVE